MPPVNQQSVIGESTRRPSRLIEQVPVALIDAHSHQRCVDAKELALASGYILSRHFFGCDDLHYGYWRPGAPVDVLHLADAQARFSEVLIAQIPSTVKTILDVGCGTGAVAQRLIQSGYRVDCVSPSLYLTPFARERLTEAATIYECRFEDLETTARYDAVLFCESFQYVKMADSLRRAAALLNPGGCLMIADFFSTDAPGKSPLGGGHRLRIFYEEIGKLPFTKERDLDITVEAAPTVSVMNDVMAEAVRPIWEMIQDFLRETRPWLSRIIHWALRRKIDKFERKHLVGAITPAAFARFKSYRMMVYRTAA
jgi:SAM-dependent methyltransferase